MTRAALLRLLRALRRERSPVLQFAVSGLLATMLIGAVAVVLVRDVGRNEAIDEAKRIAQLAGNGIVAPAIDARVMAGDQEAIDRLDRRVQRFVLGNGVVRVKVWDSDGRVIYADDPRIIGEVFPLDEDDAAAMRTRGVDAEISDLEGPENRFERRLGPELLEVYLGIRGPDGEPLLFEVYQRQSTISASGRRLWLAFAPALLGGLLLLQLVNLPLAGSLVRRLEEGQRERESLLRRALDASETERRTIAADLHDGVVQDLVGVSYSLAAEAQARNGHGDEHGSAILREGAAKTRDSVRALRTLLVDIYPPNLHRAGLVAALSDLATTYGARGLHATVTAPDEDVPIRESDERLLFRCAQEALRNIQKHAGARNAEIVLRASTEAIVLDIVDDGRGFDAAVLEARGRAGHIGLLALRDLVQDAGGRLEVSSAAGTGTRMRVEMPR